MAESAPAVSILKNNPIEMLKQNDLNELEEKVDQFQAKKDEKLDQIPKEGQIIRRKRWGTINSYESPSDSECTNKSFDEEYESPLPSDRAIYIGEQGEKLVLQLIRPQEEQEDVN
jgi:hypothetical protein